NATKTIRKRVHAPSGEREWRVGCGSPFESGYLCPRVRAVLREKPPRAAKRRREEKNMNKCLFGGALFAAGLAANASAQTFIYNATDTTGNYNAFAVTSVAGAGYAVSYDSGNLNLSYSGYSSYFGTLDL